jgi:hypothetical protein
MREICKSGSEGGAGQTNVSFLPLSVEKFSPRLGVSVRGLPCRQCGGSAVEIMPHFLSDFSPEMDSLLGPL